MDNGEGIVLSVPLNSPVEISTQLFVVSSDTLRSLASFAYPVVSWKCDPSSLLRTHCFPLMQKPDSEVCVLNGRDAKAALSC